MHRILGFDLQQKSHCIARLAVHLPNQQSVFFTDCSEETAFEAAGHKFTTLIAFFRLDQAFSMRTGSQASQAETHTLLYADLPGLYTFSPTAGWKPRQRAAKGIIGRMYSVSPKDTERYALRILLLNSRGPTSFEDLRTVNGTLHYILLAAAKGTGLLSDDSYLRNSLQGKSLSC